MDRLKLDFPHFCGVEGSSGDPVARPNRAMTVGLVPPRSGKFFQHGGRAEGYGGPRESQRLVIACDLTDDDVVGPRATQPLRLPWPSVALGPSSVLESLRCRKPNDPCDGCRRAAPTAVIARPIGHADHRAQDNAGFIVGPASRRQSRNPRRIAKLRRGEFCLTA